MNSKTKGNRFGQNMQKCLGGKEFSASDMPKVPCNVTVPWQTEMVNFPLQFFDLIMHYSLTRKNIIPFEHERL